MTNQNEEIVRELAALLQKVEDASDGEVLKFHTNVRVEVRGEDGEIKDSREFHNLICTVGKNKLLTITSPGTVNAFSYVAIGTGATAAAIGDTALQTEVARAQGTTSNPTAASWQVTYTFAAGTGTGTITESGLLDASSAGNLLAHQVFGAVTKGATDTLQIQWTIS